MVTDPRYSVEVLLWTLFGVFCFGLMAVLVISACQNYRGIGVRIHWINESCLPGMYHSHPYSGVTFVLWGGYTEERPNGRRQRVRWFNVIRAPHIHRVEIKRPTLMLFFHGPRKTSTWCYYAVRNGELVQTGGHHT